MIKPILAGCILAFFTVAIPKSEAGTVKVTQINDNRMAHPDNPNEPAFGVAQPTLQLSGDELKDPSKFKLTLDEAIDDVGTKLIDSQSAAEQNVYMDVAPYNVNKDGSFAVNLSLTHITPRRATKIATLKGSVTVLCGGTSKKVQAGNPAKIAGTKLDDPALKAAGVEIEALPLATQPGGSTSIQYEVTGATEALKKIEILTGDGRPALANGSWNTDPATKILHYSYYLNTKMDDAMSVVVTIIGGQKSVIVPLNLTDVPLP